jgi:hypothetical protein
MRRAPLLLIAIALAACGSDEDGPAPSAGGDPQARLEVEVRPEGPSGPARRRTIECASVGREAREPACRRLDRRALAAVPPRQACTQLFGGPAVAIVRGTLRGRRVRARFELSDGCEIARWRRNARLLGAPPGAR